jgi:membrane peptidoglycan carboxypeptidase
VFCPPTPIKSITDITGKAVPLKAHAGCTRQYDSYVARTLVNIMTNDTNSSYGTARRFFHEWYGNGGSPIAAKTGTNNSSKYDPITRKNVDDQGNSALWFVGITPNLVSAAALVNPERPTQRISNVPGITDANTGSDTFGAAASKFWLEAYGPTLSAQHWTWPTVESTPGGPVPSVTGLSQSDAIALLASKGFVGKPLAVPCGSKEQPGNVAFYSPQIAEPGATVSLCISTGVPASTYTAPTQPPFSRTYQQSQPAFSQPNQSTSNPPASSTPPASSSAARTSAAPSLSKPSRSPIGKPTKPTKPKKS